MTYAAIRIRGSVNINSNIKKTLNLLNLTRTNHCVLLEEKPSIKGMLQVTKDYITWGEIECNILIKLISKRGKLEGDKAISDDYLKNSTKYISIDNISHAIIDNKIKYKEIPDIKPIFRLNPPKKGYEGIKRSYKNKGSLGYRGKEINKLIERMI